MLVVLSRLRSSLSALLSCTLIISLVFAIIPLCRHVVLLSVAMALAGKAMGVIDTIANLQLVNLYQKDSAIFLQVRGREMTAASVCVCLCEWKMSMLLISPTLEQSMFVFSPGPAFLHRAGSTGQSPGGWTLPGRGQLCPGRQLDRQLVLVGPAAPPQQPGRSRSATTQHLPVSSAHWRRRHHQGVLCFLDHGSYQCEYMSLLQVSHESWHRNVCVLC